MNSKVKDKKTLSALGNTSTLGSQARLPDLIVQLRPDFSVQLPRHSGIRNTPQPSSNTSTEIYCSSTFVGPGIAANYLLTGSRESEKLEADFVRHL